jgi:hypothetical protein
MAISHVNSVAGAANQTTTCTVTLNFATAANDILFAAFTNGGADTDPSSISGTTVSTGGLTFAKVQSLGGGATTDLNGSLWWARATGDHNGQTVIANGMTNSSAGVVTVLRGCLSSGNPWGNTGQVLNASGTNTLAAIDAAGNKGAWLLLSLHADDNIADASQAATDPLVITERADHSSAGGVDTNCSISAAAMSGSGSTGGMSWANTRGVGLYQIALAQIILADPVSLTGSGAGASGGRAFLSGALTLTGHGDAASGGTGTITVSAPVSSVALTGHGDAAADLDGTATVERFVSGHGDASSAGRAALQTSLALTGKGTAASTGRAALQTNLALSGAGHASSTGRTALVLSVSLTGSGHAASGGTANLRALLALTGSGAASSAGTASLTVVGDGEPEPEPEPPVVDQGGHRYVPVRTRHPKVVRHRFKYRVWLTWQTFTYTTPHVVIHKAPHRAASVPEMHRSLRVVNYCRQHHAAGEAQHRSQLVATLRHEGVARQPQTLGDELLLLAAELL